VKRRQRRCFWSLGRPRDSSVGAERSAVAVPARNPQFPIASEHGASRSHDQIYALTNVGTGLIFCDMAIMLGPHYHCHLRVCRRQPTSRRLCYPALIRHTYHRIQLCKEVEIPKYMRYDASFMQLITIELEMIRYLFPHHLLRDTATKFRVRICPHS
jgi:hypothetical protein